MTKTRATHVKTGVVRLSYANIFKPRAMSEGQEPRYSVSLIIPKSDTETIKRLEAAIEAAKQDGRSKCWGGKIPGGLHTPLRDGDTDRPEDENYKNSYFINANSRNKPGIIDRARREIEDETEVYSGCYAKVTLDMFPYSQSGNRGVGCGLGNILKWQDGEPLGGRVRPEADFDDEEFDEYDADDDLLG